MQLFSIIFLILAVVVTSGCQKNEYTIVPVSGTITLDGEPLEDAMVSFMPIATGDSLIAGPGSFGKSDANGVFMLAALDKTEGAKVGSHKVKITKWKTKVLPTGEEVPLPVDLLHPRYNSKSKLTFEVPEGGSDSADFELKSGAVVQN